MKRILLDTNIILDFLLERSPFFVEANALFQFILSGELKGYVTATTLTDIFYIVKKSKGSEIARQYVANLLVIMTISPVSRRILQAAISSELRDFEDAVQLVCATRLKLGAIITRDRTGFRDANLPILSTTELLQIIVEERENLSE